MGNERQTCAEGTTNLGLGVERPNALGLHVGDGGVDVVDLDADVVDPSVGVLLQKAGDRAVLAVRVEQLLWLICG